MNKAQVLEVFKVIKSVYPNFDATQEKLDVWSRVMRKMDFDRVMKKTEEHVVENKFPPSIAEISAYAPPKNDALDKMRKWEEEAARVPEETKRQFREQLQKLIEGKRHDS